jgi:DNA-binding IscR family transcriptional regulator
MRSLDGVEVIAHLARAPQGQTLTLKRISDLLGRTVSYTENLIKPLKTGGLLERQQGAGRGYRLSRPAASLCAWEVVQCFEVTDEGRRRHSKSAESRSVAALDAEASLQRRALLQAYNLGHFAPDTD